MMEPSTFSPECLILDSGPACNLDCAYCFVKEKPARRTRDLEAPLMAILGAAANHVAACCALHNRPFFLGFQGDGEWLIEPDRVLAVRQVCTQAAAAHGTGLVSFITSNGTLDERIYRSMAGLFDRICLSVDGPPSIHDRHRRFPDGGPTFARVLRTVAVLRSEGCEPICRTTITPDSVEGLPRIARYLGEELGFRQVRIEPVYHLAPGRPSDFPAEAFAENLVIARRYADQGGFEVLYSGHRPLEKHGPYCNPLKRVLFLSPGGRVETCAFNACPSEFAEFGTFQASLDTLVLDENRLDRIETLLNTLPRECETCSIREHCTLGCPDYCLLRTHEEQRERGSLSIRASTRCRINRRLAALGWT